MVTRPLGKQLHRIRAGDTLRVGLRIGQRQRTQRIRAFASQMQRLATGGHHGHLRRVAQQRLGHPRASVQHMLAVVENQQGFPRAQVIAQHRKQRLPGGLLDLQHVGQCARHESRIAERRQVDEPHPVAIRIEHLGGGLLREPSLAEAAHPGQGHQAGRG